MDAVMQIPGEGGRAPAARSADGSRDVLEAAAMEACRTGAMAPAVWS
jgi:hypothetical protein